VPIPDLFFSDLLPLVEDLDELRVTLYLFWFVERVSDGVPGASFSELQDDEAFLEALSRGSVSGRPALNRGLELAVSRGTILQVSAESQNREEQWYFINDERGRRAVRDLVDGRLILRGNSGTASRLLQRRPNVFVLYEQNIGPLTPLLAQELQQAEGDYPSDWIADAIGIAVEQNVRKWRYVRAILDRWQQDGRDDETSGRGDKEDRYRYIRGKYRDYIQY
jgi:DnaD/phage-associated family protein